MKCDHWPTWTRRFALFILLSTGGMATGQNEPTAAKPLSAADKQLLAGLLKQFLVDPQGAQRVRVTVARRTVWGTTEKVSREGWLRTGQSGQPARVYFTDGENIPAPKDLTKIDFVAACRARWALKREAKANENEDEFAKMRRDSDATFARMRRTALGIPEDSDLVLAAWLDRLGHAELAARALAEARKAKETDPAALRRELAWSAFAGMVHAYMVRADAEALAYGERLLRLYPVEAKKEYEQTSTILKELQRRKVKGTFGRAAPAKLPDGFDSWEVRKKLTYLIEALEEVDARQESQPGGVNLAEDFRVQALIQIGDAAVPALIDVVEKDERLTRSVHFWRDFAWQRTVLGVREAALTAAMSILRVQVFEPIATGDNFTARGDEGSKQVAAKLRAYWKEYGRLPFDERMMKVLTNPKATPEALREAADNLARLGEERTLATTVFAGRVRVNPPRGPNPAVLKFKMPTAAEAVLAAMDRDLAAFDAAPRDSLYEYRRNQIEDSYLFPLIELGDKRLRPVLVKRSRSARSVRMRRKWAFACHWLGDSGPLKAFAADFRDGKIKLPADDQPDTRDDEQPGTVELREIIHYLAGTETQAGDLALRALAEPSHPYHALAAKWVLAASPEEYDRSSRWFAHPYCLLILRRALNDTHPTGVTYRVKGDRLYHVERNGSGSGGVPDFLADPAVRKPEAAERTCDVAAAKLHQLVAGLPSYHPLLKDAEDRLKKIAATLDRFRNRFRELSPWERSLLEHDSWRPRYIPDIALAAPATADDVAAGRAVFHLAGNGKLARLKLPASAVFKRNEKDWNPPWVLIVQAEVGPDNQVTYGVIGRNGIQVVPGTELVLRKRAR